MKDAQCCKDNSKQKNNLIKVVDFLKIVNEPNRLKILCLLKEQEKCVCDIWEALSLPQNLASHHLKTLKKAGLITSRQEGRKVIYSSNKNSLLKYTSLLNSFLTSNL